MSNQFDALVAEVEQLRVDLGDPLPPVQTAATWTHPVALWWFVTWFVTWLVVGYLAHAVWRWAT